jgi:hypothetical protein
MGRLQTEWLASEANPDTLTRLSGTWIDRGQRCRAVGGLPRPAQLRILGFWKLAICRIPARLLLMPECRAGPATLAVDQGLVEEMSSGVADASCGALPRLDPQGPTMGARDVEL